MREIRTIRWKGNGHGYGNRPPIETLAKVLSLVFDAARGSVLMAFEGRSVTRGRKHNWFVRATDIRFIGLESDGEETLLQFETPRFDFAAEEIYSQQEFWATPRPPGGYTAFDTMADAVIEVGSMNKDSGKFDDSLLRHIGRFGKSFGPGLQSLVYVGGSKNQPAVLDPRTARFAKELVAEIPSPQRVRMLGTLDMIRFSTQSFGIKAASGQEIRGVLIDGEMESLKQFLDRPILIEGKAVYRPSGQILRIDVEAYRDGRGESEIWTHIPAPLSRKPDPVAFRVRQGVKTGVAAFFGTWPGDETESELLESLKELDR